MKRVPLYSRSHRPTEAPAEPAAGADAVDSGAAAAAKPGRWAALAGDTASAIRAFRHYLLWREDPEPSLIPERDSVLAELTRLLEKR